MCRVLMSTPILAISYMRARIGEIASSKHTVWLVITDLIWKWIFGHKESSDENITWVGLQIYYEGDTDVIWPVSDANYDLKGPYEVKTWFDSINVWSFVPKVTHYPIIFKALARLYGTQTIVWLAENIVADSVIGGAIVTCAKAILNGKYYLLLFCYE